MIAEEELAFVVGTPEGIRRLRPRQRCAGAGHPHAPAPSSHQAVAVEHRMHRADRGARHLGPPLLQSLAEFRGAPARILLLEPHDRFLHGHRELIGMAIRPPAAIGQAVQPDRLIPLEDLVAGLARDAELVADPRHLLALEQAGDEPESLVHDVTLLPRHRPSHTLRGKVSPMSPEYGVTYLSGRTLNVFTGFAFACRRRPPPVDICP
jgi:hypothetical protein